MSASRRADVATGILLDDDTKERERLAKLLSSSSLTLTPLGPSDDPSATVETIADAFSEGGARVLILDYRLDDADDASDYRGGSVAAAVRDFDPLASVPIVLLTTEEKLKTWVVNKPGTEGLFDLELLKGCVTDDPGQTSAQLEDLARGYHVIEESSASGWELVSEAMEANDEAISSWAALDTFEPASDSAADIARWVLKAVRRWDGPLVSAPTARVITGLTAECWASSEVQSWLDGFRYRGIFSTISDRFWSARLREEVGALSDGNVATADRRAAGIGAHLGLKLEPAGCVWCGGMRTVRSCDSCHEPVDAAHSVRLITAPPPDWADSQVICFRCVQRGLDGPYRLSPEAKEVVEQLHSGELANPTET